MEVFPGVSMDPDVRLGARDGTRRGRGVVVPWTEELKRILAAGDGR
jgi:hypothetical protein